MSVRPLLFRRVTASDSREWIRVYDFRNEHDRIRDMQKVSNAPNDHGLSPTPLIGSKAWWHEIERGDRPMHVLEGTISRVYWGSMGDWPEFVLRGADGTETTWTRLGDLRRFVEGLGARIAYVDHRWKRPQQTHGGSVEFARIDLWIDVHESRLRSSGIAPGPGGSGYDLAARNGRVVHYLTFDSPDSATSAISALKTEGFEAQAYPASTCVVVRIWQRVGALIGPVRAALEPLATAHRGRYDGGETVTGDIWGPR